MERIFDSVLPWGSWLRAVRSPTGVTFIVDEDGGRWPTVRDCFWTKRLSMSRSILKVRDEQLELMLVVLGSMDRRVVPIKESVHEVFGNAVFHRFYHHWLHSIGLIAGGHLDSPLDAKPTAEGLAVVRMLLATRPFELQGIPIGAAAVRTFGEPGSRDECDRERFAAIEGKARRLPFCFVRERLFGKPGVAGLYRDVESDLPLIRTVWSATFADDLSRDRMFEWLWTRLDRWTAWGELARGHGASALTEHILSLIVLDDGLGEGPKDGTTIPLAITHEP